METDSLLSARQVRQPIAGVGDVVTAFDSITYEKGAAVLAMIEEWVDREKGAGTFMRGVSEHVSRHRFAAATSADFIAAVERASGMKLSEVFAGFLDHPGVPLVDVTLACDGAGARLISTQSRYLPAGVKPPNAHRWSLPLCVRIHSKTDNGDVDDARCFLLPSVDRPAVSTLPASSQCPAWVLPAVDGSGYYRTTMSPRATRGLFAQFKWLTETERLSLATSVWTSFSLGRLTFAEAANSLAAFADESQATLASTAAQLWTFGIDELLYGTADADRARDRVGSLYRNPTKSLGFAARAGEPDNDTERRARLMQVMAFVARDDGVRKQLSALGRQQLRGAVPALAPDLRVAAMAVAFAEMSPVAWSDELAGVLSTAGPVERAERLRAAVTLDEPAGVDRIFALVFDARLKSNERVMPLSALLESKRTRAAAWALLKPRLADVMAVLTQAERTRVPLSMRGACDEAIARDVDAAMRPLFATVPGLERTTSQAVEDIGVCVLRKRLQQASAQAFVR
jgi:cytosol alanyl aminopeptidase